jgi:hypothetical protein
MELACQHRGQSLRFPVSAVSDVSGRPSRSISCYLPPFSCYTLNKSVYGLRSCGRAREAVHQSQAKCWTTDTTDTTYATDGRGQGANCPSCQAASVSLSRQT